MSWFEDFDEWFRRRRRPFSGRFFEDLDRMFEELLKEATRQVPRDLVRERSLPDGSTIKEFGPFVYGYSVTIGPDGKPTIRQFGNVKPSGRLPFGPPKVELKGEREPLVDIIDEGDSVRVVAEVPGVSKEDVKLDCTTDAMTISVDTERRKYHKKLTLPSDVDPDSAKASYINGILEVKLAKTKPAVKGRPIKVE